MKFSISPIDLGQLLKNVGMLKPKKADTFTLSACAARIFVEFKGEVAGIESLVFTDGAVTLPALKFRELILTYKGTPLLSFQGGPSGLKIQNFTMPVLAWNPSPAPPGNFQIFTVSKTSTLLPPSDPPASTPTSPARD